MNTQYYNEKDHSSVLITLSAINLNTFVCTVNLKLMLASHQVVKVNTPGNFTKFKSIQKDIGLVETKTLDTAVYKLHETIKL